MQLDPVWLRAQRLRVSEDGWVTACDAWTLQQLLLGRNTLMVACRHWLRMDVRSPRAWTIWLVSALALCSAIAWDQPVGLLVLIIAFRVWFKPFKVMVDSWTGAALSRGVVREFGPHPMEGVVTGVIEGGAQQIALPRDLADLLRNDSRSAEVLFFASDDAEALASWVAIRPQS